MPSFKGGKIEVSGMYGDGPYLLCVISFIWVKFLFFIYKLIISS